MDLRQCAERAQTRMLCDSIHMRAPGQADSRTEERRVVPGVWGVGVGRDRPRGVALLYRVMVPVWGWVDGEAPNTVSVFHSWRRRRRACGERGEEAWVRQGNGWFRGPRDPALGERQAFFHPPRLTRGLTFPPGSPSLLDGQPLCPSIPRGESQTGGTQLGTGEPPAASSWAPVPHRGAGLSPQSSRPSSGSRAGPPAHPRAA